MTEPCIHEMEYGCTICSGKDRPKPEPDEIEYAFWTKYDGHCNSCNLPVHVGQRAAKTVKGKLIHEGCKS